MDPTAIAGLVAIVLGGGALTAIFTSLVRQARKRGEAEGHIDDAEKERDAAERKVVELAKPRARGRRLLDRLQDMGRR